MKKVVLIGSLVGITAALFAVQEKTVVKNKQEYPTVILNSPDNSNRFMNECPRSVSRSYEAVYASTEGQSPEMARHCQTCMIGVFSLHENEEARKCTWCGLKEKTE
jgi:hypothetical protein